MEFLVEFDIKVPEVGQASEIRDLERAEASAASRLAKQGHIERIWKRQLPSGEARVLGLYRAGSQSELNDLLASLPLYDWMTVSVTGLDPHPNDPGFQQTTALKRGDGSQLPEPRLTLVYRLDATLGEPLDLGETAGGRRRIVPLTAGTFTGPELCGQLVPGASADWQIIQPDGTALADIRYTLQSDEGALLYVQSRGARHGSPEVLARLGRGEDVDPSEYTFRTSSRIETADAQLGWMNKGVFVSVGGRQPSGVTYETYLVG